MKDYCACGFRRIEQTFLSGGAVYCVDCSRPLCCDVVHIDPTVEPHHAEVGDGEHFGCWAHRNCIWNLAVLAATARNASR